jgi:hypothetical protein
MGYLTVRDVPNDLIKALRKETRQRGKSLNQTPQIALILLIIAISFQISVKLNLNISCMLIAKI